MTGWPWPPGAATGVGSLPGTDLAEATKLIFGELPALPHLPELPARGPGADLLGRASAFLPDLPVELYAGRWRAVRRGGADLRQARRLLQRDLDTLTEIGQGYAGPVKVQAAGPWTLAAGLDLSRGGRMLRDRGAVRDLAGSLAEGLRAHVADLVRRLPQASVLLQLDEPALPAVLAGRVPTESGLHMLASVEASTVQATLGQVIAAVGVPVVVHCCASDVPVRLLRAAGAAAISIDLARLGTERAALDALGGVLDAGTGLFAGAVATSAAGSTSAVVETPGAVGASSTVAAGVRPAVRVAETVTRLWRQLGFDLDRLPEQVVVTPACGLAGASLGYARFALSICVEAGQRLADAG